MFNLILFKNFKEDHPNLERVAHKDVMLGHTSYFNAPGADVTLMVCSGSLHQVIKHTNRLLFYQNDMTVNMTDDKNDALLVFGVPEAPVVKHG